MDAGNVDKYADRLPEGQVALVKAYKGYRIDVYPTHRSCTFPDSVAERSKKNATTANVQTTALILIGEAIRTVNGYSGSFKYIAATIFK